MNMGIPWWLWLVFGVACGAFVLLEGQLMGLWHVLPDGAHACGSVLDG